MRLENIAYVQAGQGAPQGDGNYCKNGKPFVKAGNLLELIEGKNINDIQNVSDEVAEKYKLKLQRAGSILFAKSGMSCMKGYVYVLPEDAYVVSHLAIVTPKNPKYSKYLGYYFNHHKPNQLVKDTAYPSISLKDIQNMHVEIKNDDEINKIVSSLDCVSFIISKQKEMIKYLDDLIKARFVEMFGNPIDNEKGWKVNKFSDLCTAIGDGLHGTPVYDDDGLYPFINGNNFRENRIEITSETRRVGQKMYDKYFIDLDSTTIMLSINGTLGRTALYNGETVILGKSACYSKIGPLLDRKFVLAVFLSDAFQQYMQDNCTGTTIRNFGLKALRNYPMIVPPIDEQHKYIQFVKQVDKSKFINFYRKGRVRL